MATLESRLTPEELIDRARALRPRLWELREETRARGMISPETVESLRSAGLLRIFQPRRYGGLELDWGIQVQLGRELAKSCGSTGWIVSVGGAHAAFVGRFPLQAQDDVWGDGNSPLVSTGGLISGEATPVEGGYLLRGAWRFSSGVDHAGWGILHAPVTAAGATVHSSFLVPASDFAILDDWNVLGLRGTGTKQTVIEAPVFVPAHRVLEESVYLAPNPPGASVNDSYIYRFDLAAYRGTSLLGPILGAAEGALEDYVRLVSARAGARGAGNTARQVLVAEASATIAFASWAAERMLETYHRRGAAGEALSPGEYADSMRDRSHIARTCVQTVHQLILDVGASGLSEANPIQWNFRDLSAMVVHGGLAWDRVGAAYGQWAFGLLEPADFERHFLVLPHHAESR